MNVILHPEAEAEYEESSQWYNSREPGLGDDFLDELNRVFESLEINPGRFPLLETVDEHDRQFRRLRLHRLPYYVVFEIVGQMVHFYGGVSHVRRRPNYWMNRA